LQRKREKEAANGVLVWRRIGGHGRGQHCDQRRHGTVNPADLAIEALRPAGDQLPVESQGWPWAAEPASRERCLAEPARWQQLRQARDPEPAVFEGMTGMASWPRRAGWPVEKALRDSPCDSWWYDDALPLDMITSGFPAWDQDGQRADTGESAQEFASIVHAYEREMRSGSVFPPVYVFAARDDAADLGIVVKAALGMYGGSPPLLGIFRWHLARPQLHVVAGRHRLCAAWRMGMRTFPAFVVDWQSAFMTCLSAPAGCLLPAAAAARDRGRRFGVVLGDLEALGAVKVAAHGS
jgi:hypothetical protein